MYRPRLRPHLHVDDEGILVDQLVPDRDVQLSATGRVLARALDGNRTLDEILDDLVSAGASRDVVATSFRWLLLIHAVEGAGDAVAAKVARVARGEQALPLALLEDARFECQGSGACCQ